METSTLVMFHFLVLNNVESLIATTTSPLKSSDYPFTTTLFNHATSTSFEQGSNTDLTQSTLRTADLGQYTTSRDMSTLESPEGDSSSVGTYQLYEITSADSTYSEVKDPSYYIEPVSTTLASHSRGSTDYITLVESLSSSFSPPVSDLISNLLTDASSSGALSELTPVLRTNAGGMSTDLSPFSPRASDVVDGFGSYGTTQFDYEQTTGFSDYEQESPSAALDVIPTQTTSPFSPRASDVVDGFGSYGTTQFDYERTTGFSDYEQESPSAALDIIPTQTTSYPSSPVDTSAYRSAANIEGNANFSFNGSNTLETGFTTGSIISASKGTTLTGEEEFSGLYSVMMLETSPVTVSTAVYEQASTSVTADTMLEHSTVSMDTISSPAEPLQQTTSAMMSEATTETDKGDTATKAVFTSLLDTLENIQVTPTGTTSTLERFVTGLTEITTEPTTSGGGTVPAGGATGSIQISHGTGTITSQGWIRTGETTTFRIEENTVQSLAEETISTLAKTMVTQGTPQSPAATTSAAYEKTNTNTKTNTIAFEEGITQSAAQTTYGNTNTAAITTLVEKSSQGIDASTNFPEATWITAYGSETFQFITATTSSETASAAFTSMFAEETLLNTVATTTAFETSNEAGTASFERETSQATTTTKNTIGETTTATFETMFAEETSWGIVSTTAYETTNEAGTATFERKTSSGITASTNVAGEAITTVSTIFPDYTGHSTAAVTTFTDKSDTTSHASKTTIAVGTTTFADHSAIVHGTTTLAEEKILSTAITTTFSSESTTSFSAITPSSGETTRTVASTTTTPAIASTTVASLTTIMTQSIGSQATDNAHTETLGTSTNSIPAITTLLATTTVKQDASTYITTTPPTPTIAGTTQTTTESRSGNLVLPDNKGVSARCPSNHLILALSLLALAAVKLST